MPIIQRTGEKGQLTITLTKAIMESLGWEKGDVVQLVEPNAMADSVVLKRTIKAKDRSRTR